MRTHNTCLYREIDRKYTGCNLKTTELPDGSLIGACAVIRANTVCIVWSVVALFLPLIKQFLGTSTGSERGWLCEAKVSCSFCHQGVQLILAYSWARPAVLAAGKGRGWMLLFLLFLRFLSFPSFFPVPVFHLLYYLFYLFSPSLWEMTQNDPQGLTCH